MTSRDHSLRVLLDPQSIAIIGASDNPDKIGGRPIRYLSQFGYRGRILPINPHRNETQNLRSYPDLDALPEVPEVAIIAVAGDAAVGIISQSGAMSVVPYGLLRQRGIGVRYTHATGNDADVTTLELAAAVAEDPDLKVLLLYLEGIPDPEHLEEAARIAARRN